MATIYTLNADALTAPQAGAVFSSGQPVVDVPLNEVVTLSLSSTQTIELIGDAPVSVLLPGPSSANPLGPQANCLLIKIVGPRVKATITTADGSAQVIPVDPLLILNSESVSPITALTLTRTPGVDTFAYVFLGQI